MYDERATKGEITAILAGLGGILFGVFVVPTVFLIFWGAVNLLTVFFMVVFIVWGLWLLYKAFSTYRAAEFQEFLAEARQDFEEYRNARANGK